MASVRRYTSGYSRPRRARIARLADDSGSNDIQAVERVARILQLFDLRTAELSAAQAAEQLGLNRSTVQRYFSSMLGVGLLERGATAGSYAPGSLLSLWGTVGPVVMHVEADLTSAGVVSVRVGSRLSVLSAQAVVFLAFSSDERQVEAAISRLSPQARAEVKMLITAARGTGVTTYLSEATGVGGVAAPIFDATGICATLAILGTQVTTASEARREQVAAAEAITREMGGQPFIPLQSRTG